MNNNANAKTGFFYERLRVNGQPLGGVEKFRRYTSGSARQRVHEWCASDKNARRVFTSRLVFRFWHSPKAGVPIDPFLYFGLRSTPE